LSPHRVKVPRGPLSTSNAIALTLIGRSALGRPDAEKLQVATGGVLIEPDSGGDRPHMRFSLEFKGKPRPAHHTRRMSVIFPPDPEER